MENVWDYLRGNKLSSLVWDSDDAILDAREDAWNFLVNYPRAHHFHRNQILGVCQTPKAPGIIPDVPYGYPIDTGSVFALVRGHTPP